MTPPEKVERTAALPLPQRRASYQPSFRTGDYFIVHHLQRFIERELAARLRPSMTVLDVGCGEQPLRGKVEQSGAIYVSADVTQNASGTVDHIAPITALPLPDAAVDLLLCTEVLEHVAETDAAFREMARVLAPAGVLVLTTPLLYPLHEEPHDFVRLTPFQIQRCAKAAGLEVLELEKAGNEFEVLASIYGRCWIWLLDLADNASVRRWCAIAIGLTQAVANALAVLASRVLPRERHHRVYLNTMCVLRKIGSA